MTKTTKKVDADRGPRSSRALEHRAHAAGSGCAPGSTPDRTGTANPAPADAPRSPPCRPPSRPGRSPPATAVQAEHGTNAHQPRPEEHHPVSAGITGSGPEPEIRTFTSVGGHPAPRRAVPGANPWVNGCPRHWQTLLPFRDLGVVADDAPLP